MCGRYTGNEDDSPEMKAIYTETRALYPDILLASGEIFPTNTVPVLKAPDASPMPAVWGYPGFQSSRPIINARSETAADKPLFRDGLLHARCAVPTTGYYEWSPDKKKHLFRLPGKTFLCLAGCFRRFPDGIRFVILTTAATEAARAIHPRMPVLLTPADVPLWLTSPETAVRLMRRTMPDIVEAVVEDSGLGA